MNNPNQANNGTREAIIGGTSFFAGFIVLARIVSGEVARRIFAPTPHENVLPAIPTLTGFAISAATMAFGAGEMLIAVHKDPQE